MHTNMPLERGNVAVLFAAKLALVRFDSGVRVRDVIFHISPTGKHLTAQLTRIPLGKGVPCPACPLRAFRWFRWLRWSYWWVKILHFPFGGFGSSRCRGNLSFRRDGVALRVSFDMALEAGVVGVGPLTYWTDVRLLPQVHQPMVESHVASAVERFSTVRAGMIPHAVM
uniref:Uncharacterized protein n=1 Tax=Anopheles atroparvus TaxID=41427 RepID=A0AAG5DMK9_ANOAO